MAISLWPHFWPSLYADALQKVTISKLSTMCPSFTPVRSLSLLFPVITNYSRVKLVLIQIRVMIMLVLGVYHEGRPDAYRPTVALHTTHDHLV